MAVGEERKQVAHATPCHAVGVNFITPVMESLGRWSEEAATTISKIGRLLGQHLGLSTLETPRHLFQRCAIYISVEGKCQSLDPPSALSFSFCTCVFMTIIIVSFYILSCFIYCILCYFWLIFLCLMHLSSPLMCIAFVLISDSCHVFWPHFSFYSSFPLVFCHIGWGSFNAKNK